MKSVFLFSVLVFLLLLSVRCVVFSGFKREGHAVDTEPLTGRVRSVIKHMTQVGITLQQNMRVTH